MAFMINRRTALAGAAALAAFPAAAEDKKVIIGTWGGDYSRLLTKNIDSLLKGTECVHAEENARNQQQHAVDKPSGGGARVLPQHAVRKAFQEAALDGNLFVFIGRLHDGVVHAFGHLGDGGSDAFFRILAERLRCVGRYWRDWRHWRRRMRGRHRLLARRDLRGSWIVLVHKVGS